jgi:uncharacterized damage-inducible protein DinB
MKESFLSVLGKSKEYTIAVANAMPEKGYAFRPVETVWNFEELVQHISYGVRWWTLNYIQQTETAWTPPESKKSKKDILADLENAYAFCRQTLEEVSLNENTIAGFHATIDHITHHRGQAVLHLRLQGIVPPDYTY